MKVSRSVVSDSLRPTPWPVAHQAPPSMGFSRQQHWSGLPFLSPEALPTQELNTGLLRCRWTLYRLSHQGIPGHVDLGKSPTTGHQIYKWDGIDKRATEKRTRLPETGKGSFESISASDTLRAESKCGITTGVSLRQFKTSRGYVTITYASRHRDSHTQDGRRIAGFD